MRFLMHEQSRADLEKLCNSIFFIEALDAATLSFVGKVTASELADEARFNRIAGAWEFRQTLLNLHQMPKQQTASSNSSLTH